MAKLAESGRRAPGGCGGSDFAPSTDRFQAKPSVVHILLM